MHKNTGLLCKNHTSSLIQGQTVHLLHKRELRPGLLIAWKVELYRNWANDSAMGFAVSCL